MGLPGIFEVYQLAIGPSTVFTTGALRIGQAFREVLLSSPYRSNYRILVELSGNFSKFGRESNSDQAVIAGLGGFKLEESGILLKTFYEKIREKGCFPFFGEFWPFNPESDLIFQDPDIKSQENLIRFHLTSKTGQPVFQADYYSVGNGLITGTGIEDPVMTFPGNSPENLSEIQNILSREKISLLEYIISGECHTHRISHDHFMKRMLVTWKLMMARSATFPPSGNEQTRAAFYATALSEEILKNRPVITAPTCSGSAIVPAVLRFFQEKYLFSDEKMAEGLVVGGIFGSLILHRINQANNFLSIQSEIACSAAIASASAVFLIGGSMDEIEMAATMSVMLYSDNNQREKAFEPKAFTLLNSMMAQTLPSLVDLARFKSGDIFPKFDETLKILFQS